MIDGFKYDEKGLIPAIVQDVNTNEVLMMAYMNEESLRRTVETGYTNFWSRSRQTYWKKGETSGSLQEVKAILVDCDKDTLLIKV
ncbi:MAG: phosphoribosyl-AMP cyclohydrolase, partial [Candidatus Magnetoovum sp. WYHC-5]|nr:phosphoribosyl-AMP cyclohydrolase [Candidatus Magnetoovum sp. WYHC-5]